MNSTTTDLDCPVCNAVGRHKCPGGTYLKFDNGELVPARLHSSTVEPWPHMVPLGASVAEARAVFRARLMKSYPRR